MTKRHLIGFALSAALLGGPAIAAPQTGWELGEVRDAARLLEAETVQLDQFAWGGAGRARPHQEGVLRHFTRLRQEAREFRHRVEMDGPYAGNAYVRWQQLWSAYTDAHRALHVLDRGDLFREFEDVEYHMNRLDQFYDARAQGARFDRDGRARQLRAPARYVAPRSTRPVIVERVVERPVVRRVVVVDDDDRPGKAKAKGHKKDAGAGHQKGKGKGHDKHDD
jgi:hypothetical protein